MDSHVVLNDFEKALSNLEAALSVQAETDLEKVGCIQYFEFCFELAWKSIQALAREAGFSECNSPKACLKQAFSLHWLNDEVLWLEMLSDRNRMAHTYNAADAMKVYESLNKYLPAFQDLLRSLKAES
jgi:nucleotidyltransferase substrate binding protein (TIGR01987 family)